MPALDLQPPQPLPPALVAVIEQAPMPGLGEGPKDASTRQAIEQLRAAGELQGGLLESALWLLAGELDRSHAISQSQDSAEGSYWHGIMHRREGDFGNAKYWFRRAANHPLNQQLAELLRQRESEFAGTGLPLDGLVDPQHQANRLVDLCQTAVSERVVWQADLQRVCWWEWQLLVAHSH